MDIWISHAGGCPNSVHFDREHGLFGCDADRPPLPSDMQARVPTSSAAPIGMLEESPALLVEEARNAQALAAEGELGLAVLREEADRKDALADAAAEEAKAAEDDARKEVERAWARAGAKADAAQALADEAREARDRLRQATTASGGTTYGSVKKAEDATRYEAMAAWLRERETMMTSASTCGGGVMLL